MKEIVEESAEATFELLKQMCPLLGIEMPFTKEEGDDETMIIYIDEWLSITIYWGEINHKAIVDRVKECVCFDVSTWNTVHNYPSAPDDVDEYIQGTYDNKIAAVYETLTLYYQNIINGALTQIEESKPLDIEADEVSLS